MRAYLAAAAAVNTDRLPEFPEPVWSYERRTRWSGAHNPGYRHGRYMRLRHKIEHQVDREDRWLAAFLRGECSPQVDPLVRCVLHVLKTGAMPDNVAPVPSWAHEVRRRLELALGLRPADWWAVRAPREGSAPRKDRSPWWGPRRSWSVAWRFIRAARALRRYLLEVHAETVRRAMGRRDEEARARAQRLSDLRSGHPYPHREADREKGGFASRETTEPLAVIIARMDAKMRAASPPEAM